MSALELPPVLFWLVGAALLPVLPVRWRAPACVAFPAAALVHVALLPTGTVLGVSFVGYDLVFLQVGGLSKAFGLAFAGVSVAAGIYAWHMHELRQQLAAMLYAGGALGVVFAGDFFTLLVFWEVMAVASALLVWAGGTPRAGAAGFRYLIFHLVGGSLLLAGIVLEFYASGDLAIRALAPEASPGKILILLGVLINAGMPGLHAWLPDSYPKSTVTGSIFLSAFTTKTAVYVLAVCFPGWEALYVCGLIMALYAVCYAVLANDIRLILAYHIISQVGYMVAAIGLGGEFAINGATAHAYNNILYKTLMFMGAGAVLFAVGETRLTHLGGLARRMPWVVVFYLVGAAAISGFPLFNGFVSKSMVMDAVYGRDLGYALLALASVGTFLSVGIKLPYYTWFYRRPPEKLPSPKPIPGNMFLAMGLLAAVCVLYGVYPYFQYAQLPYAEDFFAYRPDLVAKALQIPLGTFVVFWFFRHRILGEAKIVLDVDWLYRKPAPFASLVVLGGVNRFFDACETGFDRLIARVVPPFRNPLKSLRLRGESGESYDPDADRASLGLTVGLTLFTVVGVIVVSLF